MTSSERATSVSRARRWRRDAVGLITLIGLLLIPASMIVMPGATYSGDAPPATADEIAVATRLRRHVDMLARDIGERRIAVGDSLVRAANLMEAELASTPKRSGATLRREDVGAPGGHAENIVLDVPGRADSGDGMIVIGAHYDTAPDTSGANDNASGVATVLELAHRFNGRQHLRPLRFVLFANEEPPYFQTPGMGSLVHAARARARGERILGMLSIETVGYYTDEPESQAYPWPLSLAYPDTGNFLAFVGNWSSGSLVRRTIREFRATTRFPSEGAALPGYVPGVGWSDHWSFWQHGYPAVMVTDTATFRDPHYHQASDIPANIDFAKLARVVSGLERVIDALANDR